jgi:hypothetical protein
MSGRGNGSPQDFSFAVPAGAGTYAPEVLYFGSPGGSGLPSQLDAVDEARINVAALPATATLEIDILKADNTWATAVDTCTTTGLQGLMAFGGLKARMRAKSGGTAGTASGTASWTRVAG